MAIWSPFLNFWCAKQPLLSAAGCHTRPSKFKFKNKVCPNCHYCLQRAVTPDWMGSTAPWEHITAEKPSGAINSCLFWMSKKGLKQATLVDRSYYLGSGLFWTILNVSYLLESGKFALYVQDPVKQYNFVRCFLKKFPFLANFWLTFWSCCIFLRPFRNAICSFYETRARFFKLLRSSGIDYKESITPAYVAWQAGTITLFLLGS